MTTVSTREIKLFAHVLPLITVITELRKIKKDIPTNLSVAIDSVISWLVFSGAIGEEYIECPSELKSRLELIEMLGQEMLGDVFTIYEETY